MLEGPFAAPGMLRTPRTRQRLVKPWRETRSQLLLRPCEFPRLTAAAGRELSAGTPLYIGRSTQG